MLLRSIVLATCFFASFTIAADEKISNYYVGASAGIVNVSHGYSVKEPINAALNLGYNLSEKWALEGMYTNSIRAGEYDSNTINSVNSNYDYDVDAIGAYGVFRSSGSIYLKAKTGLITKNSGNSSATNLSIGAGIGFRFSDDPATNFELEATMIASEFTYYSAALNFGF